jgi:uncharacterized membrane protein HdeD (DUF308 family)
MIQERTVKLQGWVRALSIVIGLISLGAGLMVLAFPGIGVIFLVSLLSVALVFMGIERIVIGASGQVYNLSFQEKTEKLTN